MSSQRRGEILDAAVLDIVTNGTDPEQAAAGLTDLFDRAIRA
jgi:hypothetical protein